VIQAGVTTGIICSRASEYFGKSLVSEMMCVAVVMSTGSPIGKTVPPRLSSVG
jgi:hypothetical protein